MRTSVHELYGMYVRGVCMAGLLAELPHKTNTQTDGHTERQTDTEGDTQTDVNVLRKRGEKV